MAVLALRGRGLGRCAAGRGRVLCRRGGQDRTGVIALFVVVLKWVKVAPLAMLAAFAATFLVYWIVLLSAATACTERRGAAA